MDARKFGLFIQTLRRELGLTQAQLGERLGVTDKAISRWERGVGFPDISLLEPLAEALGVTVVELMRSEKIEAETITKEDAGQAMAQTIELAELQRRLKRRARLMTWVLVPLVMLVVAFLMCVVSWYVREPSWLRTLCTGVIIYSGTFVSYGLGKAARFNPLEPMESVKPKMYYITTILGGIGMTLLGFCWVARPYSVTLFRWMAVLGVVFLLTWGGYRIWLDDQEARQ